MILALVCFLVNALSSNWKVTAAVFVAGAAAIIGRLYRGQRPLCRSAARTMLGRFSLLGAFDSFSVDHVFDVPGDFAVSLPHRAAGVFDRASGPKAPLELKGGNRQ